MAPVSLPGTRFWGLLVLTLAARPGKELPKATVSGSK